MKDKEWLDELEELHNQGLEIQAYCDVVNLIHLARKGLAAKKLATQSKNLVYNAKQVLPEIETGEVDPGLSFMYCIDLTEEALAEYEAQEEA